MAPRTDSTPDISASASTPLDPPSSCPVSLPSTPPPPPPASSSPSSAHLDLPNAITSPLSLPVLPHLDLPPLSPDLSPSPPLPAPVLRCLSCRKRVGLLGFKCRCGGLFCSSHRYSDLHDCSFDYKAAGRAVIARENPLVTASKIVKI